jgi:hypothetical protein
MIAGPARIGIDYDGTLADTNMMKAGWIRENLGRDVDPRACDRTSCVPIIGAADYERMADAVYERDWSLRAPPVPGALDALRTLARRGKVYVITARLPHRVNFARRWLEMHGVSALVSALLSSAGTDKPTLCAQNAIRVLIDDDVRHLVPAVAQGLRAVLLKPGGDAPVVVPLGVEFCRSWTQVLAKL